MFIHNWNVFNIRTVWIGRMQGVYHALVYNNNNYYYLLMNCYRIFFFNFKKFDDPCQAVHQRLTSFGD